MAYRIKQSDLDRAISILSNDSRVEYGIDKAYGGYKLVSKDGSREFSKRGTKREIYDHIWVAIEVIRNNRCVDQINRYHSNLTNGQRIMVKEV